MQEDILMTRIAQGDEASFNELHRLWSGRVESFARRRLKDHHKAEDIAQETFMRLQKAAPQYKGEGKFDAYIFKIASNLVNECFRGKPVDWLDELLDDETLPHPQSLQYSPEESVIDGIDIERLLASLPARQKEALMLVGNWFTYAEGAEMLGITTGAFAHLVMRARQALIKKMAGMSD